MRFLLLAILVIVLSTQSSFAQEYLWPTNSGNYLSSTFGETRSAHFHAGLDIKTWGQEGYEVYAAKNGILHRLLVTERGYGNAIYLKHPNGTYTVYAHLQRFNDHFQFLMDSVRLKDFSFEQNLILDSLNIQVKQGDVIGYTGSTGIGPPHLHFEIRDSLQHPVNALTSNLDVKDTIPPIFSSLVIEPLNKNTWIEGQPISYFKRVQKKDSAYHFGEIRASGSVGLAVNVYDQANDVYNAYAVHSLGLKKGSDTLFYQELNHFNYAHSHEMFIDRIAPFGSNRRGHQRLYGTEGHNNPFYLLDKTDAKIKVVDTTQSFTIFANDYYGNRSEATLSLSPISDEVNRTSGTNGSSHQELPLKDWYWSNNWASPDLRTTIALNEEIRGFPWKNNQILQFTDSNIVHFARLEPGTPHQITSPDHQLRIQYPKNTFFDTLTVATKVWSDDKYIRVSIQPGMIPIKSSYNIALYLEDSFESEKKYRLFRVRENRDDYSYVDSYLSGKTLFANPGQLGEFVVLADNDPPAVSDFKVYKTDFGKWEASVRVSDNLTDIDSGSAKFTINGQQGIAVYDYEEEILIYHHPNFNPLDENEFSVIVKDKAGNTTHFKNNRSGTK